MCDYSLAGVPNRLAVEGEQLVVHRFPHSLGLASPSPSLAQTSSQKTTPAVCVAPGARLLLRDIPEDLTIRAVELVDLVHRVDVFTAHRQRTVAHVLRS